MTVSVSNTNLNDSFNAWRLNTNFVATVVSNNVVTVSRAGSANRGGVAKGNGHVAGTFTANELRTTTLRSGNTSDNGGWLYVNSNTSINATSLTVTANTIFQGNVDFLTSGLDRLILGDISRIRVTGGSRGQFLRIEGSTDTPNFKSLTLRDITDMSSNAANLILSGTNSTFSDNGDSPHLILTNGTDRAHLYLASDAVAGDSDVYLNLVATDDGSSFIIADSSNTAAHSFFADGTQTITGRITSAGLTSSGTILPNADDSVDLGSSGAEFKDAYIDGVAYIDELSMGTSVGQGVATSLIPKTDAVGNLGSTTRKWGTVWADNTNGGLGVFKTLGVSQTLNVNGAVTMATTLGVTGDASVGGQLNVSENIVATGNTSVGGTLTVTGATTLNGAVNLGDVSTDIITVNGNFANQSTIGTASFDGTLLVTGTTSLNGEISLGDAQTDTITVKGKFANQATTGTASFNGDVFLGNASGDVLNIKASVGSNILPDHDDGTGHYDLGHTLKRWHNVYANNAFANNITTDNNVTIKGNLTVEGTSAFATGETFEVNDAQFGTLTVTGATNLNGAVNLGDASFDTVSVVGVIDTNLIPSGSRNIGSASAQWNKIFVDDVDVTDNYVKLNVGQAIGSAPTDNIGFVFDRGSSSNAVIQWNEANDAVEIFFAGDNALTIRNNPDEFLTSNAYSFTDRPTLASAEGSDFILVLDGTDSKIKKSTITNAALVGPQGAKGQKGEIGAQGPQGAKGQKGEIGAQGPQGAKGQKGEIGAQGPQGAKGQKGEIGAQGPQGAKGEKGQTGAQGLTGPTGPTGPIGPQGAKGNTGAQGLTGPTGPTGPIGPQGATGPIGPTGAIGPTGPQGAKGNTGATGPTGPIGPTGPAGGFTTNSDATVNSLTYTDIITYSGLDLTPDLDADGSGTGSGFGDYNRYIDVVDGTSTTLLESGMILDAPWNSYATRFGISVVEGGAGDTLRVNVGLSRASGDTFAIGNIYHSGSSAIFEEGMGCTADGVLYLLSKQDIQLRVNNGDDLFLTDNELNATDFTNAYFNQVTAASYSTFSDERIKKDITVVENALEKVSQIRGVEFTYISNDVRGAGLIAQEVEKVLPQAVSQKIMHTKTDDENSEYKVVEYNQTIALLVEAIKELKAEIDELKKNK